MLREQTESTETIESTRNKSERSKRQRHYSFGQRLAAVGVGAVTMVGGLTACGENTSATPEDTSTPSSVTVIDNPGEATPTETATPTQSPETETTVESLRIPADLPAEQLAQETGDLFTEWLMADANQDEISSTKEARYEYDGSQTDFINSLAQENADLYATALMSDEWAQDPATQTIYDSMLQANKEYIGIALQRFTTDQPLLERSITVANVSELEAPEGQRKITFELTDHFVNSEYTDQQMLATYTYSTTDGTARLIAAEHDTSNQ